MVYIDPIFNNMLIAEFFTYDSIYYGKKLERNNIEKALSHRFKRLNCVFQEYELDVGIFKWRWRQSVDYFKNKIYP